LKDKTADFNQFIDSKLYKNNQLVLQKTWRE